MSKDSLCRYDPLFVPTPDLKDPFSIPYSFLNRDYNSIDDRPLGTQVKVNKRWYEKKSDDNYYLFIKIDVDLAEKSLKKIHEKLAKL
jgi:hypothetical protein